MGMESREGRRPPTAESGTFPSCCRRVSAAGERREEMMASQFQHEDQGDGDDVEYDEYG
ncbi:MAG TPA: hypothetical protein VJ625_12830 [Propionibacteriaceae bacterium]|nr:hypothetical protein [Propionibacteriaceae bacterium]